MKAHYYPFAKELWDSGSQQSDGSAVEPVHEMISLPDFGIFNSTSKTGHIIDEKQLQALANELAKNLKAPEDLNQFDRLLKKNQCRGRA